MADNEKVTFLYTKNPQFRAVHVDGVIGATTPRGLIHFAVYSERPSLPDAVRQDVLPDGHLGPGIDWEGRRGITRELEVDLMLDEQVAADLQAWLGEMLRELRERREGRPR